MLNATIFFFLDGLKSWNKMRKHPSKRIEQVAMIQSSKRVLFPNAISINHHFF